jgi:predicted NAD/FAD-dependent oxidoreductase
VTGLSAEGGGWSAADEAGKSYGPFDRVVVAVPPPQARPLLGPHDPDLDEELATVQSRPTWTVMLAFDPSLPLEQDLAGAFVEDEAVQGIFHNSAKPGRPPLQETGDCWVVHGTLGWSQAHVEASAEAVVEQLSAGLGRTLGLDLPKPTYAAAHRWLLGHVEGPLSTRWLQSTTAPLAYCGDACTQGSPANIERAWLSGLGLGEHLAGA